MIYIVVYEYFNCYCTCYLTPMKVLKYILFEMLLQQIWQPLVLYFKANATVERLDLEGNNMGPDGARYICEMLLENSFITELVSIDTINTMYSGNTFA